jgi:hypothetical protein
MSSATLRTYEDDRPRRRDRACVAVGLMAGAGLGALAGIFARPSLLLLTAVGTIVGGITGRLIAPHVSSDEWDPPTPWQPFVGASSPDDDSATD